MPVSYPHGKSCVHRYEKFNILRSRWQPMKMEAPMRDTAAVFSLALLLFMLIDEMGPAEAPVSVPKDAVSATE
jgi:hypothetical protein